MANTFFSTLQVFNTDRKKATAAAQQSVLSSGLSACPVLALNYECLPMALSGHSEMALGMSVLGGKADVGDFAVLLPARLQIE